MSSVGSEKSALFGLVIAAIHIADWGHRSISDTTR